MFELKRSIAATGTALVASPSLADVGGGSGGQYYGHMFGGGMGVFGVGVMVVFWGGVIVLSVLAVRWITESDVRSGNNNALNILRERLAKGEIDIGEFEERRKALEEK